LDDASMQRAIVLLVVPKSIPTTLPFGTIYS
jgi:hypothetical protein